MSIIEAKKTIHQFVQAFDTTPDEKLPAFLESRFSDDCTYYVCHPFDAIASAKALATDVWLPLRHSFQQLKRRPSMLIGGINQYDNKHWVMNMGHFMGLFDNPFMEIRPTGKLQFLRYAEFFRLEDGKITATALFVDWLDLMQQVGMQPLPVSSGSTIMQPGPDQNDGMLLEASDPAESARTLEVVEQMISDLDVLNKSGDDHCSADYLGRTWHQDMQWYGPAGIGSTYTIERYQQQHQYPFRENLTDKRFNGHVCRFADGRFACFFGWPNLSHRPTGGFLGMTASQELADMRIVDVYSRRDDKLNENWVYIDLPYWFKQQGLDVLGRTSRYS